MNRPGGDWVECCAPTRRRLPLRMLSCMGMALAAACQPPPEGPPDVAMVDAGPSFDLHLSDLAPAVDIASLDQWQPDLPAPDLLSDDEPFATQRAACAFKAGATTAETFGPSIANTAIPIDTFVILVKENRSFDHYYSSLPAYGQPDVDAASPTASNPDSMGNPVSRLHAPALCIGVGDIEHSWSQMHADWNNGAMDGFVKVNGNSDVMQYFTDADLPFYYAMANTFAIADHYFAPVLGPTGPNRYFLYAGTAAGIIDNRTTIDQSLPNLFDALSNAKVDWTVYAGGAASFEAGAYPHQVMLHPDRFRSLKDFQDAAMQGRLPSVVFLRMNCSDEHPDDDVQVGQRNTEKVYNLLRMSPQWMRTALFVTHDEGGGFYDHVPPPPACAPDSTAPKLQPGDNAPGDFAQLGFRVPMIVVSPWSRPHFVAHTTFDHTSLLRLLELRFSLPAFTARDANATTLLEMFDFSAPRCANVPMLPPAIIEKARSCNLRDGSCVDPPL